MTSRRLNPQHQGEPARRVFRREALDLSGLEGTAHYSDGADAVVTGYTAEPADGSVRSIPRER
jgi:hypothetical protein